MMLTILNPEYAKPSSAEFRILLVIGIVSILVGAAAIEAYLIYLRKNRTRRPLGEGSKLRFYAMLWALLLVGIPYCVAVVMRGAIGVAISGIWIGVGLVGIADAILNRLPFIEDK